MLSHRLSGLAPFLSVTLSSGAESMTCRALIDTGASMTAVHPLVIERHRPMKLGNVDVSQVGDNPFNPRVADTFYVRMIFMTHLEPSLQVGIEVVEATPASDCLVLIGRDLMSRWIVTRDGPADHLVIAM